MKLSNLQGRSQTKLAAFDTKALQSEHSAKCQASHNNLLTNSLSNEKVKKYTPHKRLLFAVSPRGKNEVFIFQTF